MRGLQKICKAYGGMTVTGNNGNIASMQDAKQYACMVDCLHIDDIAAMLKERGLEKRPEGK